MTEKSNDIDMILKEFSSEFGKDIISVASNVRSETRSSGSLLLDIALGGGFVKGGVVGLQGKESSGKSTTTLMAIAQAQRDEPDKLNMIVDLEFSFDKDWARLIGADPDKILLVQPLAVGAEKVYEQIDWAIKKGNFAYIVLDSVDGLVPLDELEEQDFAKESRVGGTAKINTKAMRKIVHSSHLKDSGSTLIMVQQLRDAVGGFSRYGTPTTTTGGRSLRHVLSQRLSVRPSEYHTKGSGANQEFLGETIFYKVTKNKIGPPHRTASVELYYEEGIDKLREVIKVADIIGVLPAQGGGWRTLQDPTTGEIFTYKDIDTSYIDQGIKEDALVKWQGEDRAYKALVKDISEMNGLLYAKVMELVNKILYANPEEFGVTDPDEGDEE